MTQRFSANGSDFEYEAMTAVRRLNKYSIIDTRGTTLDKMWGTDTVIDDLRVDWTTYVQGKVDYTELGSVNLALGARAVYGVRTGNGRCKFNVPVLVIALDFVPGLVHYADARELFLDKIQAIFDAASAAICDWADTSGVDYDVLFAGV